MRKGRLKHHADLSKRARAVNFCLIRHLQWRSLNADKVTHTKGRLLDQTMSLFNFVPSQNGNFSLRKEFAPRGSEFFPL